MFDNDVIRDFALRTGITVEDLEKIIDVPLDQRYKIHLSRERNNKVRKLLEPIPSLKEIQRKILRWLERGHYQINKENPGFWHYSQWDVLLPGGADGWVHGFKARSSIVTNCFKHRGAKTIFHLDLKNAFGQIDSLKLKRIFRPSLEEWWVEKSYYSAYESVGYSCEHFSFEPMPSETLTLLLNLCLKGEELPTGAPSSPFLFNLACLPMDYALLEFCHQSYEKKGEYWIFWSYSRYTDNLTISSNQEIIPEEKRNEIIKIVEREGFRIGKMRYWHGKATLLPMTGRLWIDKGEIKLHRRALERYRALIHNAAKESHSEEIQKRVEGYLAYVKQVYFYSSNFINVPKRVLQSYQKFQKTINH